MNIIWTLTGLVASVPLTIYLYRVLSSTTAFLVQATVKVFFEQRANVVNNRNTADYFERCCSQYSTNEAMTFEDRSYTYSEMDEECCKIANWGLQIGLKPGDVISLFMKNCPEFYFVTFAMQKLGVSVAFINTDNRKHTLKHALDISGGNVVVLDESLQDAVESADLDLTRYDLWVLPEPTTSPKIKMAVFKNMRPLLNNSSPISKEIRKSVDQHDPALLIYTSGTTGNPKATRISHRKLVQYPVMSKNYLGFTTSDRIYVSLPIYHLSGFTFGINIFNKGGCLCLDRKFSASTFFKRCHDCQATLFVYIGELCRYLLNTPPSEYDQKHSIRACVGNGLRPDVWKPFQERFAIRQVYELYTSSEAGVTLMNFDNTCGSVGFIPPMLAWIMPLALVKYDVATGEHVRDSQGRCIQCEADEPGELITKVIRKKSRILGGSFSEYTSKQETQKKLMYDVFSKGDEWWRSGDLLRKDRNGNIFFVDRIGDTFRWKGQNVSTSEVSKIIGDHAQIVEANVYGVQVSQHDGRAGMVSIIPKDASKLDMDQLYKYLSQHLSSYANPLFLRISQKMVTTSTFKHKKNDLVDEGYDPTKTNDKLYFRNDKLKKYQLIDKDLYKEIPTLC